MVVAENRQTIEGKGAQSRAQIEPPFSTLNTSAKVISKMAMKKAKVKCGSKMAVEKKRRGKIDDLVKKKGGCFIGIRPF